MKLDQSLALVMAVVRDLAMAWLSPNRHRHDANVNQFKRFAGENL